MIDTPRTFLRTALALLVLAASVAAVTAPAASAKQKAPCWKTLINDWYDGRIDRTYEVHCYKEALKHLPQDVRTYSDAYDVISRALADATHGKKDVSGNAPVPPPPSDGGGSGGSGGGSGGSGSDSGDSPSGSGIQSDHGGGTVFGEAADRLGSDSADSVPIPLLVLAGLALLLVAAGAAGLLARRLQARRSGPRT